ncbi:T9SS type A sorting domain-containing protein [Hymenobacter armeniacus]|uniref:T9SS type A sorting domain-containing protein n=1 Tax=Hymenobacter armeniacus TaxID=2771358 RepID=A0ABR8JR91_9BACT|nr:T9SS type A sorting domain-containing protein [Hymenobacter armeniacus]MBD2721120.1 T9SS type A sorting domain-containing protein [Hymenobacter armeniacus]
MRKLLTLLAGSLLPLLPAAAQDLTNASGGLTVEAGATLYVGTGGLSNQAGATLTNAGALRVEGPLVNAGTLGLSTGTLEVRDDLTNTGTLAPGTSAVTFSGPDDQLLTPGGATLYQVVVNKTTAGTNTLRLAADLTVSNALTLTSGLVNTKNGSTLSTLRLPNGATLGGEAPGRYVLGKLEITRNAVAGSTAVDFGLGAVLNPAGQNLGTVVVTRRAGLLTAATAATPDGSFGQNLANSSLKGIDRIWTVVPATQPSAAVQLTLSWPADNDNGLTNFAQARGWQQASAGQPWAPVGAATNASTRSLALSPTVLNRFTVSNAANPLPVTLVDFTAQAEGPAAVRLRWATASELNNVGFTVERSLDGHAFAAIGTVAGAGSSTARHDYSLLDGQLPVGALHLYYRLRQLDADGTASYSTVRTVNFAGPVRPDFVLYPNPAQRATTAAGLPANTLVEVLDATGRRVARALTNATGTAHLALPEHLPTGVYAVRTSTAARRLVVE